MIKYILVFVLFSFNLYAQENNDGFIIKPYLKGGVMFSGYSGWEFSTAYAFENDRYNINPNFYLGIGVETKGISVLENSFINFCLEVSYGIAKTKKVILAGSESDFKVKSIPIVFWTKFKSLDKISPFIRVGLGIEKSEFTESYYDNPKYGFDINNWFFCYGIGGGIDFNYFDSVKLSLFVDSLTKEKGFVIVVKQPEVKTLNLDYRSSIVNCGLLFEYNF